MSSWVTSRASTACTSGARWTKKRLHHSSVRGPALALGRELPVRQAAALLRCRDKQLWRCVVFYVDRARTLERFEGVRIVGIDKTKPAPRPALHHCRARPGCQATAVRHRGCEHQTLDFAVDLKAHGGDPAEVRHVCLDMRAAYPKGAVLALSQATISYDCFHYIAMAIQAMGEGRCQELRTEGLAAAQLSADPKSRRNLLWRMRRTPAGWTAEQINAMHRLQRSELKSASMEIRMTLREIYAHAAHHNSAEQMSGDPPGQNWARRCRLEPFKKLATTIKERFDVVVRGLLDHRSNAFVESMSGQLQQANERLADTAPPGTSSPFPACDRHA
jgi:transposase